MNSFEIHAGWLEPPEVIGICHIESTYGKEIISFSYTPAWIKNHPGFVLAPDVAPLPGRQYPPAGKICFGFLSDIAPDRWGRGLLKKKERLDALAEGRTARGLRESDYILGIDDRGRAGGIRCYDPYSKKYVADTGIMSVPPMEDLRKLEQASILMEQDKDKDNSEWLRRLIMPGASLGGARPKANVLDTNGDMWIAKFPSVNDETDIGAWEMVAHNLAAKCGIRVPEAKLIELSDSGHTFLCRRFDRSRIARHHFMSAMTMLGLTDGDSEESGFLEIAEAIEEYGKNPEADLKELWLRAVFGLCISNTDNHLRNHGFILEEDMWSLSPAYDLNPSTDKDTFALAINSDNSRSFREAIELSELFRIKKDEAVGLINNMKRIINESWRSEACRANISSKEQPGNPGRRRQATYVTTAVRRRIHRLCIRKEWRPEGCRSLCCQYLRLQFRFVIHYDKFLE